MFIVYILVVIRSLVFNFTIKARAYQFGKDLDHFCNHYETHNVQEDQTLRFSKMLNKKYGPKI